jgi:phosphohistidine phosphatase
VRRLTLIRHAHTSVERASGGDFERPLSERGERDAELSGQRLNALGFDPALILSSTAARAEATARILAQAIGLPETSLRFSRDLYCVSAHRLAAEIETVESAVLHVALVSHNPGISELYNWLCDDNLDGLPPCGITRLELAVDDWREITPGCGALIDMSAP